MSGQLPQKTIEALQLAQRKIGRADFSGLHSRKHKWRGAVLRLRYVYVRGRRPQKLQPHMRKPPAQRILVASPTPSCLTSKCRPLRTTASWTLSACSSTQVGPAQRSLRSVLRSIFPCPRSPQQGRSFTHAKVKNPLEYLDLHCPAARRRSRSQTSSSSRRTSDAATTSSSHRFLAPFAQQPPASDAGDSMATGK